MGECPPRGEPAREVFAIERSAQQMSFQCEMLPDRTEARQEGLRALRVAKASHAPLALPCGLMAVLCSVVDTGRSLDEHMLHVEQLRDIGFRHRIAAQLIGDDLAWHRVRAQHTLEETFGGGLVAPLLQQDIEFDAMLVDCTPQQVRLATQGDEHLVEVPRATWLAARRFHPMGKACAELVAPAANRLVANHHAALEQQFFDIAQAELEPEVSTHRVADDRRREPMAVIKRFRFLHDPMLREHHVNVTTPK
ncbi:hypothetical protein WK79_18630 [Burkholderia ubonensis]|nr:hypothetical protein WK79_18630 [Burkholderia ubonensis]